MALPVSAQCISSITGGVVIGPPGSVVPGATTGLAQQGFDELLGVALGVNVSVDPFGGGAMIPAGTFVNSHMIFLDTGGAAVGGVQAWCFCGRVLAVMSDVGGNLESLSNGALGAPGTTYPAAAAFRGLEPGDGYAIAGKTLLVNMNVTTPGDWIRVVTAADGDAQQGITLSLRNGGPSVGIADSRFGAVIAAGDILTVGNAGAPIRAPHAVPAAAQPEVLIPANAWGLAAPAGGVVELDDFSFGRDTGNTFVFSVDTTAIGCIPGMGGCLGPSAVFNRGYCSCLAGGCGAMTPCIAAPDVFRKRPAGGNALLYNATTQLGLVQAIGNAADDDVDGLDVDTTTQDLEGKIYFTVNAATAAANTIGGAAISGADILVFNPCTGAVSVFATAAQLGLNAGDDVDGLALFEDGSGAFNPAPAGGDIVWFSLRRGSPTVGQTACSMAGTPLITEGDILTVCNGGAARPAIRVRVGDLGLHPVNPSDDLDALDLITAGMALCYANCDDSTTSPVLNVNDYICFQNAFAAGDAYANCDNSTTPPVLNVNDFVCFSSAFAAGCQ
jgi:hypothetical protein